VRLTTPIYPGEANGEADKRLQDFIQAVVPNLAGYLPSGVVQKIKPAMIILKSNHS